MSDSRNSLGWAVPRNLSVHPGPALEGRGQSAVHWKLQEHSWASLCNEKTLLALERPRRIICVHVSREKVQTCPRRPWGLISPEQEWSTATSHVVGGLSQAWPLTKLGVLTSGFPSLLFLTLPDLSLCSCRVT